MIRHPDKLMTGIWTTDINAPRLTGGPFLRTLLAQHQERAGLYAT